MSRPDRRYSDPSLIMLSRGGFQNVSRLSFEIAESIVHPTLFVVTWVARNPLKNVKTT
jgi:hypothetical protein